MKILLRFLLVILIVNGIGNLILPNFFTHPLYDRNPAINQEFKLQIDQERPDVFIMGNSLVARGLNIPQLESLTGLRILKADRGGSASALWYLILKNNIAAAETPPPHVVFVFRDNIFAAAGASTQGKYRAEIDEFAGADETILNQLAYINYLSPLENFLANASAFYRYKDVLRETLVYGAEYPINEWLFHTDVDGVDAAIDEAFRLENLDPELITQAQQQVDLVSLQINQNSDFYGTLDQTFLPAILKIANDKGIQLIFVRYRARHYVEYPYLDEEMETYFIDMKQYLANNGAYFVDFSADERIGLDEFAEGDHYNGDGNIVFTEMLAEVLNRIISGSN